MLINLTEEYVDKDSGVNIDIRQCPGWVKKNVMIMILDSMKALKKIFVIGKSI